MNREGGKQHPELKNLRETADASKPNNDKKLIEVKKRDTAEDSDNNFVVHEEPFDEQMSGSFRDSDDGNFDEEAD